VLSHIFTSEAAALSRFSRFSSSDERALWCKCNPDTDMGISRVASEIQIYSAVHSHSSLVETRMSLLSLSLSLSLFLSVCVCVCAVVHPAGCRLANSTRSSRKSHLFHNKVA
jgi:hypothetical protein